MIGFDIPKSALVVLPVFSLRSHGVSDAGLALVLFFKFLSYVYGDPLKRVLFLL